MEKVVKNIKVIYLMQLLIAYLIRGVNYIDISMPEEFLKDNSFKISPSKEPTLRKRIQKRKDFSLDDLNDVI